MTDIYVVTDGEYSDYGICAIYTAKADAEYHAEHFGGRVETHELNPYRQIIADGLRPYHVIMDRDGNTDQIKGAWIGDAMRGENYVTANRGSSVRGHFHMLARDDQHAVKIANERRTRAIAENRWPPENASPREFFSLADEPF